MCVGTGTPRVQPRQHLELNPWLSHCPEGIGLPVCLLHLFPHDYIETRAVLVAEDEASVVIISGGVYVECALKVHAIEGRVTCRREERAGVLEACLLCLSKQGHTPTQHWPHPQALPVSSSQGSHLPQPCPKGPTQPFTDPNQPAPVPPWPRTHL